MSESYSIQIEKEINNSKNISPSWIFQPWKVFLCEGFLFSLTLILGILAGEQINKILKTEAIHLTPISFWRFLLYFLLSTLLILLLIYIQKFKKTKGIFFKIFFILSVFWGSLLFLSLWIPPIFALILICFLVFNWLKNPLVWLHNLVVILGIAGVGAVLGFKLTPWIIAFLLIIFSIYDVIAVYKTKHMVKMAKAMVETGTIFGLIAPFKISDFKASLKKVKPGGNFLILGGGDVIFPLVFSVSLIPQGIINSFVVAFFALIGLFISFWFLISQKTRAPIPALPPIALFSLIGFLILLIL